MRGGATRGEAEGAQAGLQLLCELCSFRSWEVHGDMRHCAEHQCVGAQGDFASTT